MSRWPEVAIGEVADPVDRSEAPIPGVTYRQIGVRLWGEGAYERESMDGAETKYKTLNRVEAGDIIVNKIWARNGSVGVVSGDLAGCYCSGEFPLFQPRPDRLDPRWFYWITKTRWFWERCDEQSRGTSGKNRLRPQKFLEIPIPLAPIEEQRRVVRRIEQLASQAERIATRRAASARESDRLGSAVWVSAFPEANGGTLGNFVFVQSGYAFKSEWFEPEGIRLVRNVNIGHGTVSWGQTARISESRRAEFASFELNIGDVLVSLDRPVVSTGVKVARVRPGDLPSLLLQRVGRCMIRTPGLDSEYLFYWLRSPRFVGAIDPGRSNGVPHISPKDIERIPFAAPPIEEQARVVQRLRRLETREHALSGLRTRVESAVATLVPSVLRREM